jgi:cation-transporting P-type ATPase E
MDASAIDDAGEQAPAAPVAAEEIDPRRGLSLDGVRRRREAGRSNDVEDPTSRSVREIIRANVLTPFNFLLGSLLLVILAVGEFRDALFGIVLVLNALIGIVQEVRSKRALDRLALLNAPHATVVREGETTDISTKELVLDDVILLSLGDQISVDGAVLEASGLEVDESLLTGEADPVDKDTGDEVLSGSFVVAGSGRIRATKVGVEAYAFKLSSEARRFSLVSSELRTGVDRIIKFVGWLMLPTAILLVSAQIRADTDPVTAVQGSVAGLGAMIPEGLVLLTSIAFAVGATRLARKKVLTQELAAIEGLARVDVICLDKTGTLTEGRLVLATVEHLDGDGAEVPSVLASLGAADEHPNPSLLAIKQEFGHPPGWSVDDVVPFSSARKWSAASFHGHSAWVLGAPEILLSEMAEPGSAPARVQHYAERGRRVLMLAAAPDGLRGETLPDPLQPAALVVLEEKLRETAPDTIQYFRDQEVEVKVISGDNPVTVGAVSQRVGVPGAEAPMDARELPDDDPDRLAELMDERSVFGRVTPQQKRAMVHALQARGHVVAMTGDGVNDTLALKDADIGVAMGSGSPAARAVARFVLLDNDFSVFPSVVAEGRRVIANVERVANLFLTKTFYAMLLALSVGVAGLPFPFIPRHFTVISSLTIGIPGFFLALAPNARRARPHFLRRVVRFAAPAGLIAASATLMSYQVARIREQVPVEEARTVAVITLFMVAMWVLGILSRPFNTWRVGLVGSMAGAFFLVLAIPQLRDFFALPLPDTTSLFVALASGSLACLAIEAFWRVTGWVDRHTSIDLEMAAR